jgi:hypothetical protein
MKICNTCKQKKELTEFCNNKNTLDGKNRICKLCKKELDKQHFIKNKEKLIKINTEWTHNNREKRLKIDKTWRENNKDKIKDINKKYRINNPHYKIRNLWHNLKRKNFNMDDRQDEYFNIIKAHIETQFTLDMNWKNIEIDHKIPVTWFKIETPSYIINDLHNLQPLLISINRIKSNKYSTPINQQYYNKIITFIKPGYEERIATIISHIS